MWRSEFWETLSIDGDKEVNKIFNDFNDGLITTFDLFERIEDIPLKFDDAEICKETTNKVFEHLIESFNCDEDELDFIYNSVRMRGYTKSDFSDEELLDDEFLKKYFNC